MPIAEVMANDCSHTARFWFRRRSGRDLQRMLVKGWVKAEWGVTARNRRPRYHTLTPDGKKQLRIELRDLSG